MYFTGYFQLGYKFWLWGGSGGPAVREKQPCEQPVTPVPKSVINSLSRHV